MSTSPAMGYFTARGPAGDDFASFMAPLPNFEAGDAEFLDPARPHELQVRPVLKSERTPNTTGEYPPGAHWLIYRSPTGKQLRAIVRLPYSRRRNVRSTAEYAVQQVSEFSPSHGILFDIALHGVDPFTAAFAILRA